MARPIRPDDAEWMRRLHARIVSDIPRIQSAQVVARAIIQGQQSMGAPAPIKGLAETLRGQLAAAVDRANQISDKAKSSVGNLHSVLDTAEDTIRDVDAAASDIQSALGLSTNGGPAGPLPGQAPPSDKQP